MKHTITQLFYILLLTALMQPVSAQIEPNKTSVGELEITDTKNQRQLALLLDTQVSGSITGMLASITIRQSFKNQEDDWVNGRYVFPLSESAAVDSLQIQIGERIIDGVIKEKEEAKQVFEQAKSEGKQAGLLEQHRPNLFSISVANIAPHQEIIATITYIDKVAYDNEVFSLRLPATLTPRYIPGAPIQVPEEVQQLLEEQLTEQSHVKIETNSGWATATTSVPDARNITPPQTYDVADQTTHHFSLDLSLDAGLKLQNVFSESHAITQSLDSNNHVSVSLANSREPLNKDLLLSWQSTAGTVPQAAHFQQEFEGEYYSMLMLNPPQVDAVLSLPRDITFIVDSSGSMAGTSMSQAKLALMKALSYLTPFDRFNIIDFDSQFRPLFSQSQSASNRNLAQANNMINRLDADGGTEMMAALNYALTASIDETYLQQIVFITDGAIGNETELFALINQKLGETRLFTVGIGSAPNSFFMNRAAKFGRGTYTYISDLNQVNEKMDRLFKKITQPVLRDINIDWAQNVEQYPENIPDLYAGEPLVVLVKTQTPLENINVSGQMLQTPWTQSMTLSENDNQTDNIDAVWARQKITDLMDKLVTAELSEEQVKPEVIKLGIAHNIVSRFTSFVAVDNTPVKPTELLAKNNQVPNLMPQGSTMAVPQTATPATLFGLLGSFLIFLSRLLKARSKRNHLIVKGA